MAGPLDEYLLGPEPRQSGLDEGLSLGGPQSSLSLTLPAPFNDLSEQDLYRGYKQFKHKYTAAKSDVSDLSFLKSDKKERLDSFVSDTLTPDYSQFMEYPADMDMDPGRKDSSK